MHHDIDLIAGAAVGLRRFATSSYLKRAVKQINGLYYGVHCAPHRDNSAVSLFKYSFLTSVIVSSSSSLPSIPPRLVFFSDESDSPGPWLFTSAMSVSALSRYYCFSFLIFCLFFFFFWRQFFFLQGPLLMQFPVILMALSLYLNWPRCPTFGADPRSWLPEPACDISGPRANSEHSLDAPL